MYGKQKKESLAGTDQIFCALRRRANVATTDQNEPPDYLEISKETMVLNSALQSVSEVDDLLLSS